MVFPFALDNEPTTLASAFGPNSGSRTGSGARRWCIASGI